MVHINRDNHVEEESLKEGGAQEKIVEDIDKNQVMITKNVIIMV